MSGADLKQRRRADYVFWQAHPTRWADNDQYAHMNNSAYYLLFDSIINAYLIRSCTLSPTTSPLIGLVVHSYAHFFASAAFPDVLDLGLRVGALGRSSVSYEVGVFRQGRDEPAVVGGYTHVFVDSQSRKSRPIDAETRAGLQRLLVAAPAAADGDGEGRRKAKL